MDARHTPGRAPAHRGKKFGRRRNVSVVVILPALPCAVRMHYLMAGQPQRRSLAVAFLCIGTLTTGTSAVLIRLCAFPSGIVASLRILIAGLVLLPFVAGGVRRTFHDGGVWKLLVLVVPGLLLGLHLQLWVAGVRQTSVATATFIFATNPVLFAIVELAAYRRRLAASDWLALALAAAGGTLLLTLGGGGTLAGDALCLASTVVFVLYLLAAEKVSAGTPHPTFLCLIYLAGGLLFLPVALARGATPAWTDGGAWLALLGLVFLPTLVGHGSSTYAVRFFPPILVSFTTLMEPILSSIAAFLVLRERPEPLEYPAYALFAAATTLFLAARWARERRRKRRVIPAVVPDVRTMKVREAIRLIERDGWHLVSIVGSHRQFKHQSKPGRVTIAGNLGDDLARGTIRSIMKQAGING